MFYSSASREDVSYNARLARYQVEQFLPLLGEVSRPRIREFEVRAVSPGVVQEATTLSKDVKQVLVDRFHRVAFRGAGLGLPISPLSARASLSAAQWTKVAREYVDNYLVKERAVLVLTGFDSKEVAPLVTQALACLPSGKAERAASIPYSGGEHMGDKGGKSHLLIGFEGLPLLSPKLHAINLIFTILGGGQKYDRDGPGNGKTSLLNRNLVEKHHNVLSASTYNASYSDTGLFGVYVQADGELSGVVEAVLEQLQSIQNVTEEQLELAKRQLKLHIYNDYSTTEKRVELSRRFVVAGGQPICFHHFALAVDQISLQDLKQTAKSVFSSKPCLITEGDIQGVKGIDYITSKLK